MLGRIHTFEQFEESFRLARAAGFNNINVDLMSAIPGQTEATLENTFDKVTALQPEHISAYSLILEEALIWLIILTSFRRFLMRKRTGACTI